MFKHLSRSLGIVLASILLLAGPPALGSQECRDAWNESDASESCGWATISQMTFLSGCTNCCSVYVACKTGKPAWSMNYWNDTVIAASVDDTRRLVNCQGTLRIGSC